jgi:hypothetical protein
LMYTIDKKEYIHDFRPIDGLLGGIDFTVKDEMVTGIRVNLGIDSKQVPRSDWAAYTPEVIFKTYGIPSGIRFWLSYNRDNQPPGQDIRYRMDMLLFFDSLDVIVVYDNGPVERTDGFYHYCPAQSDSSSISISMWVGKDAFHPPDHDMGISLENATTLSLQEFYQLITENPGTACIDLKAEAFKDQ